MELKINRYKFLSSTGLVFLYFTLTLFIPFVTAKILLPTSIKYIVIFLGWFFLVYLINKNITERTFISNYAIYLFLFICFSYYLCLDSVEEDISLPLLISVVQSFIIFIFLSIDKYLVSAVKIFINVILVISCLTILAFIAYYFKLVPFNQTMLHGYQIRYNFIFGMIHLKHLIPRPSLYFVEPSYLGFFFGFSYFYLAKADWIKGKFWRSLIVLIAGILTGSFTFYVSVIVVVIIRIFDKIFSSKVKKYIYNVYFVGFILASILFFSKSDALSSLMSSYQTSADNRQNRIGISVASIQNETAIQLLFGVGPGSIAANREEGESNAYLKLIIEEGLLIFIGILALIYFKLRHNPYLLLFTLIALHSVVLIEAPLFIFLLCISAIFSKLQKDPTKYQLLLRNSD